MANTYNFTVTLTEAEHDALAYVAFDQQAWIDNVVHERCRLAIDEVVQIALQKSLNSGTQMPTTKDEIVTMAYSQGWVKTGAQRNADAANNIPQVV
jgi:hypothetical protein